MTHVSRRLPVDTQITFKVSQPVAKLLRERAFSDGLSCHAAARAVLEEALARAADEREIDTLSDQMGALQQLVNTHLDLLVAKLESRLDELHCKLALLDESFSMNARRLDGLRKDIRTGICAILVQSGASVEAATKWVDSNIGVES